MARDLGDFSGSEAGIRAILSAGILITTRVFAIPLGSEVNSELTIIASNIQVESFLLSFLSQILLLGFVSQVLRLSPVRGLRES